jgi:hypothetical protein
MFNRLAYNGELAGVGGDFNLRSEHKINFNRFGRKFVLLEKNNG